MRFISKKTTTGRTGGAPASALAANTVPIPRTLNRNKAACPAIDERISNRRAFVCITFNRRMALNWRFRTNWRSALASTQAKTPAKECAQRNTRRKGTEVSKQGLHVSQMLRFHAPDYNHTGDAA